MPLLFLVLVTALFAFASEGMERRIEVAAMESEAAIRGFWGVKAVDLESGETIYERNPAKLFVPASNVKLLTAAAALMRLGPDHRFRTLLLSDQPVDQNGVVPGDLIFRGGGDPTLSARKVPYEKGPVRGDPLAPLRELAGQVVAAGVREIQGDVVGDESLYVHEPYPEGWSQEDLSWEYGAPVSALTLHDNAFRLTAVAGEKPGAPGRLILRPPVTYYEIRNLVRIVARGESRVFVDWPPGEREIRIWGQVRPGDGRTKLLAIRTPAHYAAWALREELQALGIEVGGGVSVRRRWMDEVPDPRRGEPPPEPERVILAERTSPPLFEILKTLSKDSQNLHAELVLREIGRVRRGVGSRAAGLAELSDFLKEAGIGDREYRLYDGSGLSQMNLVSPDALVRLLSYMYLSTERDGWLDLLAVGGEDGTLSYRFRSEPMRRRVIAKTGTLTGACALSGYLVTSSGRTLAFSMIVNNHNTRAAPARQFIDRVVGILLESEGQARGESKGGSMAAGSPSAPLSHSESARTQMSARVR